MTSSNKLDQLSITTLKNEIEETFGKKISSARDALLLSEEVYNKISVKVNSNTIRRLFGLVKSPYFPSVTTVDIFAKYCGFAGFDEFLQLKNGAHKGKRNDYYTQSIINYLVKIFKQTPVKEHNDKTFDSVVKHTILFLQRHTEVIDKFQRAVSKTKNGQHFYFEQYINIDALNGYYGDGLRYYLGEKDTAEGQIFGNSLLCLKYWFSENAAGVKSHYKEVIKYPLSKSLHPSLCGRYYATKLLHADSFDLPTENLLLEMQQTHTSIRHKIEEYRLFPYFEYLIAPILFLTGHTDEALYYIDYWLINYLQNVGTAPNIYQSMNLTKALTFAKTGRRKEAKILYRQINPSKFGFLVKKTQTIQYLLLSKFLNRSNEKSDQQLKDLITETGFTKLTQILSS